MERRGKYVGINLKSEFCDPKKRSVRSCSERASIFENMSSSYCNRTSEIHESGSPMGILRSGDCLGR
jgi:hypothetical protein